ncbi:CotS family spore coat protein [Clostridium sp. SYSU_GA19001]|uniref:CotS family spore coat protein n=1 Tax=Clostridium caldaquaticum TaxID=2940653 RepID=UPI0020776006|nr:CotS family spore coat protein [Clostridium caldaquaticum]MCM8709666.1 CotS family spore coat protein [Clostridium caldaquaticum]
MLDGRYRDKKYLSKYDLSVGLFDNFNLKVNDIIPLRHVYIIITDKGDKILKRIDYSLDNLEFINSAIKYIRRSFGRVLDFVSTKDNKVYTKWKNEIYCVMDLVQGRECDFSNPIDLSIASKGLGELHKASKGFKSSLSSKLMAGKTIDLFEKRIEEMKIFKSIADLHEFKTEFDKVFLENIEYYLNEIKESIKILENSHYNELCLEEDKIVVCHHDLAYHNIIVKNEEAYFIDFDYCIVDLKVHDLCNFISKVIKNFAFDIEKADSVLHDYYTVNSLDNRELEVLYGMLYFPEDFYSIARDYYTKRKDWEEEVFLDRLMKKVSFKEDRSEFLKEFKEKIIN